MSPFSATKFPTVGNSAVVAIGNGTQDGLSLTHEQTKAAPPIQEIHQGRSTRSCSLMSPMARVVATPMYKLLATSPSLGGAAILVTPTKNDELATLTSPPDPAPAYYSLRIRVCGLKLQLVVNPMHILMAHEKNRV